MCPLNRVPTNEALRLESLIISNVNLHTLFGDLKIKNGKKKHLNKKMFIKLGENIPLPSDFLRYILIYLIGTISHMQFYQKNFTKW